MSPFRRTLPGLPSLLTTLFGSSNFPFLLEIFHNAVVPRMWVQVACICMGKERTLAGYRAYFKAVFSWSCSALTFPKNSVFLRK